MQIVMIKAVFFIFMILACWEAQGQFKDISRLDLSDRFIAFIAPNSTPEYLDTLHMNLEAAAFKIALKDFVYTTDGQLKSFYAKIVSDCADGPSTYEGITDFGAKNQYPIAALFIGQDCSSGAFTTTYDNMKSMYNIFYPDQNPKYVFHAWSGPYEDVKDVAWNSNFTVKVNEEH